MKRFVKPICSEEEATKRFSLNFAKHSDFDEVLRESALIYKDEGLEQAPLCAYIQNLFSEKELVGLYEALNKAAKTSNNRNNSSGRITPEFRQAYIDKGYNIIKESESMITVKKANGKGSTYNAAMPCESGVAGFFEADRNFPGPHPARYNRENPEAFEKCYPFIDRCNEAFQVCLPTEYEWNKGFADNTDPEYLINDSVFSSLTINRTYRTCYHRDGNNLTNGMAGMATFMQPGDSPWIGGLVVFPRFRLAINLRPGDLLIFDNQRSLHGNIKLEGERYSVVMYYREKLANIFKKKQQSSASLEDLFGE